MAQPDLKFVKKFTRPNFRAKEFYTLKMCKSRLFSPPRNFENALLSVGEGVKNYLADFVR